MGELKQSAEQSLGQLADQNAVGLGKRLQPRREVGRFTNDGPLLCRAGADDFADHDKAGGDADPRLQARAVRQFDIADLRKDSERRANGAFRCILEGARKAEIGQHAVAHEFGDEPAISPDRTGGGVLIAPDHAAQQFGIDLGRQRGRADHVGE